jgi:hypothetical protein
MLDFKHPNYFEQQREAIEKKYSARIVKLEAEHLERVRRINLVGATFIAVLISTLLLVLLWRAY